MAQESRQSQSGLRTVRRDWSNSSQRSDSELIPWEPSPPPPKPYLTPADKRLKRIQEALGEPSSAPKRFACTSTTDGPIARPPVSSSIKPDVLTSATNWTSSSKPSQRGATNPTGTATAAVVAKATNTPVTVAAKASIGPAAIFLSPEQTQIKKLVEEGQSLFYTGSAGAGKSVLLREIIKSLRRKYVSSPDSVAVTASTGIAACNIGGVTIHSFAGIGLGIDSADNLAKKIKVNKKACARWLRTKVLIIDEISMIDGDLFDKLSRIACIIRKKVDPFGGIQIVVTGDFFQLPPVTKKDDALKFAFESETWKQTIKRTFNLTKVFRQRDEEFVNMLNEMRFGQLTPKSIARFRSLSREIMYEDGLGPTELFPRREDVDRSNTVRIRSINTEERVYRAHDSGSIRDPQHREKLLSNFLASRDLTLRIDAQVMLIKNIDETLVNGSMGRVVAFITEGSEHVQSGAEEGKMTVQPRPGKANGEVLPLVEFMIGKASRRALLTRETWNVELPNGEIQASRTQVPLILAWAMSIHKSQGQTLERVKVDLAKVFEKGQAYVALSRATSLDGLQVLHFDPNKVKAHQKVVEWSKSLETI